MTEARTIFATTKTHLKRALYLLGQIQYFKIYKADLRGNTSGLGRHGFRPRLPSLKYFCDFPVPLSRPGSVVVISIGYGLDGPGIESR